MGDLACIFTHTQHILPAGKILLSKVSLSPYFTDPSLFLLLQKLAILLERTPW